MKHPDRIIEYKGHRITLMHREDVNDWSFKYDHTTTIHRTGHYPRAQTAEEAAKHEIDILTRVAGSK